MSETDEVPVAEAALEARLADVSADAAALRVLLPAELQSLISDTVVRSHKLYEEFVDRLVLRVARETGLEAATREPASTAEVVVRLGLEPRRALVPIDWILRRLTVRRTVEEVGAGRRFRSRGVRALPDAAPVREEQRRHDSSWLPSYTLAETVAQDYPAWLRCDALDMNRPFGEQGVRPGDLAVVYAVNALHVAHDLAFTLGEVHRALAPGGELIVSECVRPHSGQTIYAEFIFNLMETFRAPRLHPVYRPMGGFLTAVEWRGAIQAAGFGDVPFVPDIVRGQERVPDYFAAVSGATRPG